MDWYDRQYMMQMDHMEPYYYSVGGKMVEYRRQFGVSTPIEVIKQMTERSTDLSRMCRARSQDPNFRKGL